jgi:hypothetical protein
MGENAVDSCRGSSSGIFGGFVSDLPEIFLFCPGLFDGGDSGGRVGSGGVGDGLGTGSNQVTVEARGCGFVTLGLHVAVRVGRLSLSGTPQSPPGGLRRPPHRSGSTARGTPAETSRD